MKQTDKLVSMLATKNIKQIFLFQYLIHLILYCVFSIITMLYYVESYRNGSSNYTWWLILLLYVILFVIIAHRNICLRIMDDIAFNQIDFEKYVDYCEYTHKKALGYKSMTRNVGQFAKGIKSFYEGDFQEALDYFNSYNRKKALIPDRKRMAIFVEVYKQWSLIHLGNAVNEENVLNDIPKVRLRKTRSRVNRYKKALICISNILNGESDGCFEDIFSGNKLLDISNKYYHARAYQNAHEVEKAKELFQQIANENPELFYVREAKQYLEEN